MEIVSYQFVEDLWASLLGLEAGALTDAQQVRFNRFFNRVIRRGWAWYFWPALMKGETRHFRAAWVAQSYTENAEVWHEDTGKYWRASAEALADDVPGAIATWGEITDLDAYVAYEQEGETAFDQVKDVWSDNFRTVRGARRLAWEYDERGVRLTAPTVPVSAWLYFRKRCPHWTGADFDGSATYAAGQRRFYTSGSTGFEGDFWTSTAATSAGESPETAPAKWEKIPVPAFLADFAANMAKILELEGDAKLEKALMADGPGWAWLYDERDRVEAQNTRRARAANV